MTVHRAAFVLIFPYFLLDTFLQKGTSAQLPKTEFDRKTTLMIVLSMGTTVVAAILLLYFGIGRFNTPLAAWSGLALIGVGFLIRVVSILQLKEGYIRTLRVEADQQLITSGMYRVIRYLGYLGSLPICFYFGVALGDFHAIALAIALIGSAYYNRVEQEERRLACMFGARHHDYPRRSWRLVPYIW